MTLWSSMPRTWNIRSRLAYAIINSITTTSMISTVYTLESRLPSCVHAQIMISSKVVLVTLVRYIANQRERKVHQNQSIHWRIRPAPVNPSKQLTLISPRQQQNVWQQYAYPLV